MTASLLIAIVLGIGAAPTKVTSPVPVSPPSPRAAARAAVATQLPPRPPTRIDPRRVPSSYSLTYDPGFTPWTAFLSLGDDRLASYTVEGTSVGSGLRCVDLKQAGCQPAVHAMVAPVVQPRGTRVGFFAGPTIGSTPFARSMRLLPGFSAGIRVRPASLAMLVRRFRRD